MHFSQLRPDVKEEAGSRRKINKKQANQPNG
jgi:hypothetical protein